MSEFTEREERREAWRGNSTDFNFRCIGAKIASLILSRTAKMTDGKCKRKTQPTRKKKKKGRKEGRKDKNYGMEK